MAENENAYHVVALAILIAGMLLSVVIYISSQGVAKEIDRMATRLSLQQQAAAQQGAPAAQGKEVVLEFLYADWCSHCAKMKPIVESLGKKLPADRFELRAYNEAERENSTAVAAVYDRYSANGFFEGFPTFVLNGNDYKAGEMTEANFKAWVCSKFSSPKPQGC
jgi:thiol-disulfide isomerase/thioredoxin